MTAGALAGRRVLELGDEAGQYCGKLLGDLGADVVRVEPPGGDPSRTLPPLRAAPLQVQGASGSSLAWAYWNTSKRSIELDLESTEGREAFCGLARRADILVESLPPGRMTALGLDPADLLAANPGLVLTSISGFGGSGPHRDYASTDLVASAMAGGMAVTGDAEDPPVVLAGSQAHVMASTHAAAASLIALHHRDRAWQGQRIDISVQEVMTSVSHICGVGKYLDDGIVPSRSGTGLFASVPSGAYPCRDGLIYLMVNRPAHWKALAQWIHDETGNQEVLDAMFEGPSSNRIEYRELLDIFISDLTVKFAVDEIYHEGQRRHIAFTPVNRATTVVKDEHLAARKFFVEVDDGGEGRLTMPGAPYQLARTPWRVSRRAPHVGEDRAAILADPGWSDEPNPHMPAAAPQTGAPEEGALADLSVVEFTAGMAGPWIGRFMAWCGAEVIKVESKQHPGVVRLYVPPRQRELGIQPALSPWFTDWDAGKRFVSLDLGQPAALALAKQLVERADVVIENFSTGVMDKLGLGYDVMRALKPDLVHISTTGYGDSGPNADYVTWGSNIEAISGLSSLSGFPERECTITQFAYPDALSAAHGLVAVMAALDHRRRSGEGQHISMSQFETTIASAGSAMMPALESGTDPPRIGNRSLGMAPHGVYPCLGDDRWCAISVRSEAEWRRLCELSRHPEWLEDERFADLAARLENVEALDERLAGWTAGQVATEVMVRLQDAGIPAGVVQTVEDLLERDPHLARREFFESIPHLVKGRVLATGIPLGLKGTPGSSWRAGADFGEDNDYVFGELLGMASEQLAELKKLGAVE